MKERDVNVTDVNVTDGNVTDGNVTNKKTRVKKDDMGEGVVLNYNHKERR